MALFSGAEGQSAENDIGGVEPGGADGWAGFFPQPVSARNDTQSTATFWITLMDFCGFELRGSS